VLFFYVIDVRDVIDSCTVILGDVMPIVMFIKKKVYLENNNIKSLTSMTSMTDIDIWQYRIYITKEIL